MTTERKIKNIIVYLVPSFIGNALPFITLPIITRFLSPQDFGISALAMSTTLIFISFFTCSVDSATQRYYFEYKASKEDTARLIGSSTTFLLAAMVLSTPLIYLLGAFISKVIIGSTGYAFAVFISYINSCLVVMLNFYLMLYRNMEKAKDYSFYRTAQVFINAVSSIILIAVFKLGYMGLIYAALVSSLLPCLVLFVLFIKKYPLCFNLKMVNDNLKFGIQCLPSTFMGSIYQFFDKYMLRTIISLSSTGIFSIAQNISSRLSIFMTAVQSVFEPIFMKDMFDKGKSGAAMVGRNFTLFTYISLSAILCATLFGEEIIYILAPKSYYAAINVFMILLSGIATNTFGKIGGSQLAYAKKLYLNFPITVFALVVNLALNIVLIPRWHASGAAFATLVSVLGANAIQIAVSQRSYKIIYERSTLIKIYLVLFISTFALIYLRSSEAPFWIKYIVKIASVAGYIAIGIKAKIITKANMAIGLKILTFSKGNKDYKEYVEL